MIESWPKLQASIFCSNLLIFSVVWAIRILKTLFPILGKGHSFEENGLENSSNTIQYGSPEDLGTLPHPLQPSWLLQIAILKKENHFQFQNISSNFFPFFQYFGAARRAVEKVTDGPESHSVPSPYQQYDDQDRVAAPSSPPPQITTGSFSLKCQIVYSILSLSFII